MTRRVLSRAGSGGLETRVNLEDLYTPTTDLVSVQSGPINCAQIELLREHDYDQALVTVTGRWLAPVVIGLVETAHLVELARGNKPLETDDPAIRCPEIEVTISLSDLLTGMARHRAVLVNEIDLGEPLPHAGVRGLLTISDLNRHPFRSVVYGLFASLEAALAWLVERHFSDPQDWISLLSEDQQAWVLGYWELSKRRGVDIGPLAATMLTQLINIVGKTDELRGALGHASRNGFVSATGRIPDIRNKIMHPVRPLIMGTEDVGKLHEVLAVVCNMTTRVLAMHPQIAPAPEKAAIRNRAES